MYRTYYYLLDFITDPHSLDFVLPVNLAHADHTLMYQLEVKPR